MRVIRRVSLKIILTVVVPPTADTVQCYEHGVIPDREEEVAT